MSNKFIDIHSHKNRISEDIITIYNLKPDEIHESKYFSLGIHPWNVTSNTESKLIQLEKFLENNLPSFIGEIGLDKLKCNDFSLQQKVFARQLELAEKYKIPVILHCVKAYEEILKSNSDKKNIPAFIFHGFNKSSELALELTSKGYYISLGKILFNSPDKAKDTLEKINHNQLFFETDDADFLIEDIYQKASEISGLTVEYWQEKLFKNFKTITQ